GLDTDFRCRPGDAPRARYQREVFDCPCIHAWLLTAASSMHGICCPSAARFVRRILPAGPGPGPRRSVLRQRCLQGLILAALAMAAHFSTSFFWKAARASGPSPETSMPRPCSWLLTAGTLSV